jgi:hypothetical protein
MPDSVENCISKLANFPLVQGLAIDNGCTQYQSDAQSHLLKNKFQGNHTCA